jgi:hypothetical protein
MRYRIDSVEECDEPRRRLLLRVSYWYTDGGGPPDVEHEIRIPSPPAETWDHEWGLLGQRRTESGGWHHGWEEVDGEWRPLPDGPPGDPWRRLNVQSQDPLEVLRPQIERIGIALKEAGITGKDVFRERPALVRPAQRRFANHPSLRGELRRQRPIPGGNR